MTKKETLQELRALRRGLEQYNSALDKVIASVDKKQRKDKAV